MANNMLLDANCVSAFQRVNGLNPAVNTMKQEDFSKCVDNARTHDIHDLKIYLNKITEVRETFVKADNEKKTQKEVSKN